jgi:hypothetical protein
MAKQATGPGVDICSLIDQTPIIFSSELIWIDWSTQKVVNFWFSKSFFYVKTRICLFFSIEEYKLGEKHLLETLYDRFHF